MKFIRASVLAAGTLFALSAVASLALPHPAFAAIHLGDPNTVSLSQGLVGYWPFDGATTNWRADTSADLSPSANTALLYLMSTTTSPIPGKIGQAFTFDGTTCARSTGVPSKESNTAL